MKPNSAIFRCFSSRTLTAIVAALICVSARADVKLPTLFSDHMVLQQDAACAVWGWADPGERVTVSIADESKSTKAGKDGKWMLKLPKIKAGGPFILVVKGRNQILVQDVLVGEVWLGSGQSNMGMTVDRCNDFEQEKAQANRPTLRMFTVERNSVPTPQDNCGGTWEICSAETVGRFSAALYFHGRELQAKLNVPMGLINSSWGGTPIEAWTSAPAQSGPKFKPVHDEWAEKDTKAWDQAAAEADYQKKLAEWKLAAKRARAANKQAPRAPQKPTDPKLDPHHPANLFNGMIEPLIPYTIRGAVWYQGENNAIQSFPGLYGLQLSTMIKDWRKRWGYEFPFAWVQLPEFRQPQTQPSEPCGWVTIQEEMLKTLSMPRTGMAITIGLGNANDIHPKNKQDVGRRLAAWALADVYGWENVVSSGPLPAKWRVHKNEIVISFKHADGGLRAIGGEVKGFAIAGADKNFVWANARIEGDKVIVSCPSIEKPVAVRYAWAQNPVFSLQNGAGIPATPFRTDSW